MHAPPANSFTALGALGCLLGVVTGAFGAHALEQMFSPDRLDTWEKAVDYLFFHSLGLFLVGMLDRFESRPCHRWTGLLMLVGIVLFSGSLFALVLSGVTALGMVTPFGGVSLILAWLLLGICYLKPGKSA
ncbi:MAG: DUF423 domain-containing protein [Xanthomonadales bacterium]|nr:DUF423 domain-containing protein [Gammaproteobacteria bacterium]MBT8051398.1 DUF423 domain-containing protein [Gammaproteobacteria bacterium]MBT8056900.1 DUF423 domain-containing protein [Gammaproteobacteria bacterium]NNJ78909.1 DUF423 domain-containing protein [Xanthomonadales bacterium]NNL05920.1 DUF423 domain-containing protein [Xanthomonadales bacterium]